MGPKYKKIRRKEPRGIGRRTKEEIQKGRIKLKALRLIPDRGGRHQKSPGLPSGKQRYERKEQQDYRQKNQKRRYREVGSN